MINKISNGIKQHINIFNISSVLIFILLATIFLFSFSLAYAQEDTSTSVRQAKPSLIKEKIGAKKAETRSLLEDKRNALQEKKAETKERVDDKKESLKEKRGDVKNRVESKKTDLNEKREQKKEELVAKKEERNGKDGFKFFYVEGPMVFPDSLDRPSRTIITAEGGSSPSRFKHVVETPSGKFRRLTPVELERLCMFPDNHLGAYALGTSEFHILRVQNFQHRRSCQPQVAG